MLDEFSSDNADDYIAGFPNHPHRGFETVTYMLDGHMLHQDHMGNRGDLKSGDVQWMTAGRGIIHSEMPQQESGRMRGFQLWINLPAKEKMKPAGYRDIPAAQIPVVQLPGGGRVRVIAGTLDVDGRSIAGPDAGPHAPSRSTSTSSCRRAQRSRSRSRPATTPSSTSTKAASRSVPPARRGRSRRTARACLPAGDRIEVKAARKARASSCSPDAR